MSDGEAFGTMNGSGLHTSIGPFLAIEGPIGVGKTTLARLIQARWQTKLVLEQFEENPFLPLFYADPVRYAWPTQLHFLTSRFDQWTELHRDQTMLVSDYLFDKDRVFAGLNLDTTGLRRYLKVFEALKGKITPPSSIILLRADVPILMKRIAERGRSYEQQIQPGYLHELASEYQHFFAAIPMLRCCTWIPTNAILSRMRTIARRRYNSSAQPLHYRNLPLRSA